MQLFGVDLTHLLSHFGALVAFLIILSESSIVFFLPGDSFIFAAAILASQGSLNLWELMIFMLVAAVLGNSLGYFLGKKYGTKLFSQKSHLFRPEHLEKTREFYAKHGPVTILLARFTPVVRTFAPILAGIGEMSYPVFLTYNIIGAFTWVVGLSLLGYYAGSRIPNVDRYIIPFIVIIVALSLLPAALGLYRRPGWWGAIWSFLILIATGLAIDRVFPAYDLDVATAMLVFSIALFGYKLFSASAKHH